MVIETEVFKSTIFWIFLKQLNDEVVSVESLSSRQIIFNSNEWVFVLVLLEVIKYVGE
jgi:hypothetical protein